MALKELLRLAQLQPLRVVVDLVDGSTRELKPHKDSRKRWTPIVDPLMQLEWVSAELFGKGDVTLAVIPNPDYQAVEAVPAGGATCCAACGRPYDAIPQMIAAQREALTWQDKSVERSMAISTAALENLNNAIASIVKVHQLQLEAAPAANDRNDDEQDVVERLLPMAARLLGGADASADALTPERLAKLGAFLDAIPTPERKPAKPAAAPSSVQASKPANGANGAPH